MPCSQSFHYPGPAIENNSPWASSAPNTGLDAEQTLGKRSPGKSEALVSGRDAGISDDQRSKGWHVPGASVSRKMADPERWQERTLLGTPSADDGPLDRELPVGRSCSSLAHS